MMLIKFFGTCKESIISVKNLEIERQYESAYSVPVRRSSHHLVPLSSSCIAARLTSEDELYLDIQSISLCDLFIKLILAGMFTLVDIAAGVINID